jgi:hypothetical protein
MQVGKWESGKAELQGQGEDAALGSFANSAYQSSNLSDMKRRGTDTHRFATWRVCAVRIFPLCGYCIQSSSLGKGFFDLFQIGVNTAFPLPR